ncbi:MAG TPA: DNA gyrase inhibitor YacG [Thermodesulfobacteriota bacterium]|nr:DNA gyrase inhibitor YacG [Thermodesulfobacteriota bacterium]
MQVRCPRCGKLVRWEGNEWRPFCGERCKLIDLGDWAEGEYRIPAEPAQEKDYNEQDKIKGEKEKRLSDLEET